MLSDDELMAETGRGSRAAFEALFERYRERVWRFFRRRTPDAGVAQELAQDTFVAILEGARRYKAKGMFRSYLFGVAYNVLLAARRKRTHWRTEPLDPDGPSGLGAAADPEAVIRRKAEIEVNFGVPVQFCSDRQHACRFVQNFLLCAAQKRELWNPQSKP